MVSGRGRSEVTGRDGTFTGSVGCDVDITERKHAENRMRASQAALAASRRRIRYLAGRLIGAQEVERARIARDLHDDVSQKLAGVSIAFSGLKQRLGLVKGLTSSCGDFRACTGDTLATTGIGANISGVVVPRWNAHDRVKFAVNVGSGIGRYIADLSSLGGQDAVYRSGAGPPARAARLERVLGYEHAW